MWLFIAAWFIIPQTWNNQPVSEQENSQILRVHGLIVDFELLVPNMMVLEGGALRRWISQGSPEKQKQENTDLEKKIY